MVYPQNGAAVLKGSTYRILSVLLHVVDVVVVVDAWYDTGTCSILLPCKANISD